MKAAGRWISLLMVVGLAGAGCSSAGKTEKGAVIGAGTGAAVGGAIGGGKGAAVGAVVGGATGAVVGDYLEKRRKELAKVVPTEKTENGLKVTLKNDLLFGFDEAKLRSEAREQLSEFAEIMKKYPNDQLAVLGFTDHIGSSQYNQELSEERAENVKEFLVSQGVKEGKLKAIGKGESENEANTPQGRQQNRRVEIYIDVAQPTA